MPASRNARTETGFTLLETLVAMTILGITFTVLFGGLSGSLRNLERVEDFERRLEHVRNKLAEIDLLPRIAPNGRASGTFEDGTRWRIETAPFIEPIEETNRPNRNSVVRVVLSIEWDGSNGTQQWQIVSYRFVPAVLPGTPIPALEEQLRALQARP